MPTPLPPGLLKNLGLAFPKTNQVIDFWSNPCDAPWYVYLETAAPVALDMLVAYVCFDISDLIRWLFRPKGLWGAARARRPGGRRGGRLRRGLGARVRAKVPILQRIKNRPVSNGVKHLWRIDEIGQRFLYWWMVADITDTGVYNFTSIMYKTAWCQLALADGAAAATDTGGEIGGAIPETILWTNVDYNRGGTFIFGGTVHLGEGTHRIIAGVDGTLTVPVNQHVRLIIAVIGGPQAGQHIIDEHDHDPDDPKGLVGDFEIRGPIDVFVQVQCTPSGGYHDYSAHVVAYNTVPLSPPEQMDCNWEGYFDLLPDGTVAKIADALLPQKAIDWWDALPASRKTE